MVIEEKTNRFCLKRNIPKLLACFLHSKLLLHVMRFFFFPCYAAFTTIVFFNVSLNNKKKATLEAKSKQKKKKAQYFS
jgi:hypothetical protein